MTDRPRCTNRSCFVRFKAGPSRLCPMCAADGDTVATRMTAWTAAMSAPGEPMEADTDGDQYDGGPDGEETTTLAAYLQSKALQPPASF